MTFRPILFLRACVFYLGYTLLTTWFSFTGLLLAKAPYHWRFRYLTLWNRAVLRWLTWTCGIRYRVLGLEHVPEQACVFLSNHQSQWETFFLQVLKLPIVPVLKRELLNVPGFGWGLRLLNPIAIDRGNPREALRQVREQGLDRLARGISVYVFPEGTRMAFGEVGNYARSGAGLAVAADVPLLPVAHNAGRLWPARSFLKYPGTITVSIGAPLDTGSGDNRALTAEAKAWIEAEVHRISAS